ncbi:MAG: hypothetical protein H7276_15635 [Caulobacter sp.]|nr:hypothetical protein [Vitreoscilla sp.]
MSEDFKPGTRPLLRLAGLDAVRAFVSRAEETHVIWTAVVALMLRLYQEPDAKVRRESGPTDSQVVAALRVVLGENFGGESADYTSWALVRYGCRQKPTMAALHPWEGLMFEWQQRRASAPRIALMLRDAGLVKPLKPASLESLDGWVTAPVKALGEATEIIEALFSERLVSYNLHDDGTTPAHDTLFGGLVASLLPQGRLQQLRQTLVRGDERATWHVEYTFEDETAVFEATASGSALDVDSVMGGVDALVERIGRPERVYRLAPGRYNNGETGVFVLADASRFPEIAWRLRLPLLRSPSVADLPAGIPTAAPEPLRVGARPMAPRPPSPAVAAAAREAAQDDVAVATGPGATAPMSLLESQFITVMPPSSGPVERAADPSMKQLINALRRSFGAGRLLQGGRWMKQVRSEPPAWMTASGDPVRIFYEKQETLFRKGRIGWGALVQADDGVFAPGQDDLPGVLVYSEDDHFDARPMELAAIGARLLEFKAAGGASDLARFAQGVRNDTGRPLGVTVPAALSAKEPLLSSFVAIRAHLPEGILAGTWFPVLIHPSSVVPMIVPSTFWPPAMLQAWNERRMMLAAAV